MSERRVLPVHCAETKGVLALTAHGNKADAERWPRGMEAAVEPEVDG
jgi:hypothetical protein